MCRMAIWILFGCIVSLSPALAVTGADVGARRDAPSVVSGANPNSTSRDVRFLLDAEERATLAQVRSALVNDQFLSPYGKNVTLQMDHGKLVIRGTVPSYYERAEVESRAKGVVGKIDVVNEVQVMAE